MHSDDKYWLYFWSMVFSTIILLTSIGIYSGHLNDQRDLEFADKGLHKYKVERCNSIVIRDEWHEAGWKEIK